MEQSPTHQPAAAASPPPAFALATDQEPGVPEGFRRMLGGGPYMQQLGPVYLRPLADGQAVIGLRVTESHLNMQGITHGGMLATVADSALGINVALARRRRAAQVTLSLATDFLASGRVGNWLEAWVTVHHLDDKLAHASCEVRTDDRVLVRATSVFSLRERAFGAPPGSGPAASCA